MRDQISRVGKCRTGKCGTGKRKTENAGLENKGPKLQGWKMQDLRMRDQFRIMNSIEKKRTNVLCIVVLHLYSPLLQCIHYFLTAVVICAFNWCIIN